jgi:hypothetical protein
MDLLESIPKTCALVIRGKSHIEFGHSRQQRRLQQLSFWTWASDQAQGQGLVLAPPAALRCYYYYQHYCYFVVLLVLLLVVPIHAWGLLLAITNQSLLWTCYCS